MYQMISYHLVCLSYAIRVFEASGSLISVCQGCVLPTPRLRFCAGDGPSALKHMRAHLHKAANYRAVSIQY